MFRSKPPTVRFFLCSVNANYVGTGQATACPPAWCPHWPPRAHAVGTVSQLQGDRRKERLAGERGETPPPGRRHRLQANKARSPPFPHPTPPQGDPARWSARDAAKWLKQAGLGSLTPHLKGVDGAKLLALDVAAALPTHSRADRDALAAALGVLREYGAKPYGSVQEEPVEAASPATPRSLAAGATTTASPTTPGFRSLALTHDASVDALADAVLAAATDVAAAAPAAKGARASAAELASFWRDAGAALAAALDAGAPPPAPVLRELLAAAEAGLALASAAGRPGWLVDAIVDALPAADWAAVHDAALDALKAGGVATHPSSGRALESGSYRDAGRALRRLLKAAGGGSLDAGVRGLDAPGGGPGLTEVSALLSVDRRDVLREVARLPADALVEAYSSPSTGATAATTTSPAASPAAALRAPDIDALFASFDVNSSGFLELAEFGAALDDLGLLDGVPPPSLDAVVARRLADADADGDGRVSRTEFVAFWKAAAPDRGALHAALRGALGPAAERGLARVYDRFATFGVRGGGGGGGGPATADRSGLDAARFAKLCRDARLVGKRLPPADVDLVFARAVPKGGRRMSFPAFLDALDDVAGRRGVPVAEVAASVLAAAGPAVSGVTRTGYVRLHDDKAGYTGVYARGGPSPAAPSGAVGLAGVVDRRAPADVRGRAIDRRSSSNGGGASPLEPARPPLTSVPSPAQTARLSARTPPPQALSKPSVSGVADPGASAAVDAPPAATMKAVFQSYAAFGGVKSGGDAAAASSTTAPTLDGARFAKLAREAGWIDARLDAAAVDLIFSRVKPRTGRRIGFREFEAALQLVAAAKRVDVGAVAAAVVATGGPRASRATAPDAVRWHDDKAAYTGVAAGRGQVEGARVTLEELIKR